MKVAIFNHPINDFYSSPNRMHSAITRYLGEIIFPDHDYIYFDVVKKTKKQIPLPEKLKHIEKHLVDDITFYSFFKDYYKFGKVDNFNHKELTKFTPDIIIISSFAYCYFDGFKEQVDYLKKRYNIPIICGGHGPSSSPEYYLNNSNVDYVIVGPAEMSLLKLLNTIEAKKEVSIDNVFHSNHKGNINLNKEYSFKPYININKKSIHLQLTRGCPKNCSYCSIKIIAGNKFHKTNLNEIELIFKKLDKSFNYIDFEDDNISFNKDYFIKLIKITKKYFPHAKIGFENGIDLMTLDKETIDLLIASDIKHWNISMVSSSNDVLAFSKRDYQLNLFNEKIDYITSFSPDVIVYFISGLPDDSIENILASLFYLAEKKVIIGISNFYPIPGVKASDNIKQKLEPLLSKGTSFKQWGKLTSLELISLFILSRFINAVKRFSNIEFNQLFDFDFKIKNNMVTGDLSKSQLTQIGIIFSFIKEKLYYVNSKQKLLLRNIDNIIENKFFNRMKTGLHIKGKECNINKENLFEIKAKLLKRIE